MHGKRGEGGFFGRTSPLVSLFALDLLEFYLGGICTVVFVSLISGGLYSYWQMVVFYYGKHERL